MVKIFENSYLEVTVVGGRNLAPKDDNGLSDPYLVLKLEKRKFKTKIIYENINPTWNQNFTFEVTDLEHAELSVTCWDHDPVNDDFMGQFRIPVKAVAEVQNQKKSTVDKWFTLLTNHKKEYVSGDIHLILHYKKLTRDLSSDKDYLNKSLQKFHKRFPDIPAEETVVEVYQALMYFLGNTVPMEGTLYCCQNYVCFYSRLLGKKMKVRVPFTEVQSVEKTNMGFVVPNAIEITMKDGAKHFIAGLFQRNKTFDIIEKHWKKNDEEDKYAKVKKTRTLLLSKRKEPKISLDNIKFEVEYQDKIADIELKGSMTVQSAFDAIADEVGLSANKRKSYELYWKQKKSMKPLRLQRENKLGDYKFKQKSVLRLSVPDKHSKRKIEFPKLPFSTIWEKFNIAEGRDEDELLYELGLHCILFPVSQNLHNMNDLTNVMRKEVKGAESTAHQIESRVNSNGKDVESVLLELEYRWKSIGCHPYYTPSKFKSPEDFAGWKAREKQNVAKLVHEVVFGHSHFYGQLVVKVIAGKGLKHHSIVRTMDPYVVLKVDDATEKTKVKNRKTDPTWNEQFKFYIEQWGSSLNVDVFDSDLDLNDPLVGSFVVPLDTLKDTKPHNQWFTLPNGTGEIHLELQLTYPFSQYITMILEDKNDNPATIGPGINFHDLYKRLEIVLLVEKLSGDELLAPDSIWLLEEFATRFGVGPVYAKLVYMHSLNLQLAPKAEHLTSLLETFNEIRKNKDPFTIPEEQLYQQVSGEMFDMVKEFLSNYKKQFAKNLPTGAVSGLVQLWKSLQPNDATAHQELVKLLQPSIDKQAAQLKKQLLRERKEQPQNQWLSDLELMKLCALIQDEVSEDLYFTESFPPEIQFPVLSMNGYYKILQAEFEEFAEHEQFTSHVFDLLEKMKDLHLFFQIETEEIQNPSLKTMNLGKAFSPFVLSWFKVTHQKLSEWVTKATAVEQSALSESLLHSGAVVDIFQAVYQAYEFLKRLDISDPFLMIQFSEVVSKVIKQFATTQYQVAHDMLTPDKKKTKKNLENPKELIKLPALEVEFKVTLKYCISLNNLERTREDLDNLVSSIEEHFEKSANPQQKENMQSTLNLCTEDTFQGIKDHINHLLDLLAARLGRAIVYRLLLAAFNDPKNENAVDINKLIDYLDDQLAFLSDNLYEGVWKKTLRALWVCVAKALRTILVPAKTTDEQILNMEQSASILRSLEDLEGYFHGGGSGLSKEFIEKETSQLKQIINLFSKPTRELIEMYVKLKKESNSDAAFTYEHVSRILERRVSTDKEAKAFIEEHSDNFTPQKKEKLQKIRNCFLLPDSELILDHFSLNGPKVSGEMYMSSSWLLFDETNSLGADSEYQIAVKLNTIQSIKHVKGFLGIKETMTVTINSSESYTFSSIHNLKPVIASIQEVAKRAGNTNMEVQLDQK